MNKSNVPESESRRRRSSPADRAIQSAVMGVFGAIVGALFAWGLDLRLAWQGVVALVAAVLAGGFTGLLLAVGSRANHEPQDRLAKTTSLRAAIVLVVFGAVFGALMGALIGASIPGGGPWQSLEGAAICGAIGISFTLLSLAVAWPFRRLLNMGARARPRIAAAISGALLGSVLGSEIWHVWFQAGRFNLGILAVGIPFAAAFLVIQRQQAEKDGGPW